MTLLTGWCMAPMSDSVQHGACVGEYNSGGRIVTCPCACHGHD